MGGRRPPSLEDARALPPTALASAGWFDVDARADWVATGIDIHPETPTVARLGVVRDGRLWAADAEGDGVAAGRGAPLPGAPARALIEWARDG